MYIVLIVILLIEAILILKWKVATHAMIYFLEKKGYTQPTKKEM